jgi:SNW domain-containing protein 1
MLSSALPAPIYTPAPEYQDLTPILPAAPVIQIPKYGARKGWKPKNASDFGGGGAYPEVSYVLGVTTRH